MAQRLLDERETRIEDGTGGAPGINVGRTNNQAPVVQPPANQMPLMGSGGGSGAFQVYTPDYSALEANFNAILQNYADYRDVLNDQYTTGKTGLQQGLENTMEDIGESREASKEALGESRSVIAEDAFNRERALQAQMSARGLSGSGIEQLGGIQNRMATGKAVSETANDFYDTQEALSKQMERSQEAYNTSLQQLDNSLQMALTQIMSQENASRSDYTQMIQNLERQVIADSNAALQAQREWQMSVNSYNAQAKAYNESQTATPSNYEVQQILNSGQPFAVIQGALKDMGYDDATINTMYNQAKSAGTSEASNAQISAVQAQINNMASAGYSTKKINDWIKANVVDAGLQVDVKKLIVGGQNYGTSSSNSGSGSGSSSNPNGYIDSNVQRAGAYGWSRESEDNTPTQPTGLGWSMGR